MTRCLVTGATGFIGSHLVEALLARGHEVICTVRPTSDPRWIAGTGAEVQRVGLDDGEGLGRALRGVTHVYHVAGALGGARAAELLRVNRDLTRSLIAACAGCDRPPRFLYVSSLAAAGPSPPGGAVSEEMPPRPVSPYGRSKLAGERAVAAFAGVVPATIVRPPVVYGPRDRGLLPVFRLLKLRLRPLIGRERRLSLIHVRDLVEGLMRAAETPGAVGHTYFITHPRPLTMEQVGETFARALGVRTVPVRVPDPLVWLAGALSEGAARLAGRPPVFNRAKAREMTRSSWVCDGSRARAELGFEAAIPHAQGIAETVRWYRVHRWL
jgi:dihydroflavonol-4-reductase